MSKYGNGLDITDVCKLELEALELILSKYKMEAEDAEEVKYMLTEAYWQFCMAARSGRVLEEILLKRLLVPEDVLQDNYMELMDKPDKHIEKFRREILGEEEEE